jgi:hypothetical protein
LRRIIPALALAAGISVLALTGCGSYGNTATTVPIEPEPAEPVEPESNRDHDRWEEEYYNSAPEWSCRYEPTYNRDWHDDAVCSNGLESFRPYLLPDDSFITEDEFMMAMIWFEEQLNSW